MQLDARAAPIRARILSFRLARVSERVAAWAVALSTGAFALVVYVATLAPSVMWYDMGEFTVTSATLGIAHNTGYPLLILVGKAFTFLPVWEVAWRVNLMSAVFTAAAVAITCATIHDITRSHIGAALGALTLAFAATVWGNATWATSYGMNLFFTALITRLMFAWWRDRNDAALVGAALAFGLGLCNHRLTVLAAPPSLLLLALGWRSLRPRTLAYAALAGAAGLSIYLYLPIRGEMEPALSWASPPEWRTYWSMFLNGQTPSSFWSIDLGDRIDILWAYPAFDLTWAGLALAGTGAVVIAGRDRAVAAYLALLALLSMAVTETYAIHNVYNYLTPAYFALSVCVGAAGAWTCETMAKPIDGARVPPHVRLAVVAGILALLPAYLLFRNVDRVDRSGDYSAYDFARTTLDRMPADAVILTDTWTASPFWYVQFVEGSRRDVLVSPVFSNPADDPVEVARRYAAHGDKVYVAEGLRVDAQAFADAFTVQPVVLESIERMVVDSLPRPEYRDDLVMTGTLYSLHETPPALEAEALPDGAERSLHFDAGVMLAGLVVDTPVVERGQVAQLTYYWRAEQPAGADLHAAVLFFDAGGRVRHRLGIPLWSQPHEIGAGIAGTRSFTPGTLYRESYFSLVPRAIEPGTYEVRIAVFDPASPDAATTSQEFAAAGTITVR